MEKQRSNSSIVSTVDGEFIKALAEPVRVDLLMLIAANGPRDIKSLAEILPQDRSVISRHLSVMETAGIVSSRKIGRHTMYALNGKQLVHKVDELARVVKSAVEQGCC